MDDPVLTKCPDCGSLTEHCTCHRCLLCKKKIIECRCRETRIEALRAASCLVAGIHAAGSNPPLSILATLDIAEQFAKWLETGEK